VNAAVALFGDGNGRAGNPLPALRQQERRTAGEPAGAAVQRGRALVRGGCPEHAAPGFGRLKGMQKGGSSGQNSAYPTSLPMIIPEAYEYRRYQSGGRRGG
jgi:hypothetical protein